MTAERLLDQVLRADRGRLMAALVSRLRDFRLAEDALQDACLSALTHWARSGAPDNPMAWLLKVALRKAIDRLRGQSRDTRKAADMAILAEEEASDPDPVLIPDERLRLIMTCCHPALDPKSRVALTLRTLCGLTTDEIAALFLDASPTMGQRLTRAKTKITAAGIPFAIPDAPEWPARIQSVLDVVYLIYTLSHQMLDDRDLAGEAIHLARMLDRLRPADPEIEGCLALLLTTQGRRPARIQDGRMVPLSEQDPALWDGALVEEGVAVLDQAITRGAPGPFQIKAAISALHCAGADATDWIQIRALYAALLRFEPTDVVLLNQAVAQAESGDVPGALAMLGRLALDGYQPFHAARAELRKRLGDSGALADYQQAMALSRDPAERAWLADQAKKCRAQAPGKSNREV
jgi:RNA polymerase sigma factor (sigma-70 family)